MAHNIVLINTLQREIKRRQARNRHIFRLISLFLPPAARGEFIPMPRGCISHRKFVAVVWDFLTDFIDFRGGVLDFSQISQPKEKRLKAAKVIPSTWIFR